VQAAPTLLENSHGANVPDCFSKSHRRTHAGCVETPINTR